MTLIDKAEALLPCPFCGGHASLVSPAMGRPYVCCDDNYCTGPKPSAEQAIAAWNRRALPARGVGVTWHPFDTAPRDGSRFLAQGGGLDAIDICSYNARVGCWDCGAVTLDDTDHEPEGYNRPAQWMPPAALAPTDAAHVNETPKSEHDGADVLTAAQARETALREAVGALRDWQDDLNVHRMSETAVTVGMAADLILDLIGEERT